MKKYYSVSEAARLMGYSNNSIYSFIKEGLIKATRFGKGKYKIPEDEVSRFSEGKISKPTKIKKAPVQLEKMVTEEKPAVEVPVSAILASPRPGMSLASLSGETTVHTLKLWFEERMGLPRLFDWLVSITAIILGFSLFLHSSQTDILSSGRLSVWMDPIRLTLIFGGVGLILAAMIHVEGDKKFDLVSLFRYLLTATFLGLALVLFSGGDIDGFIIYGLFGLMVLAETLTGMDTAAMYTFYIFGLLIGIFSVYRFVPGGSGLSVIASSLINVFSVYDWILTVLMIILIAIGVYGYLWNRKFLKVAVMIYGFSLCLLSLFYGAGNYWSRAFVLLFAGMIGLILPSWGNFRARLETNRTLVLKMFGAVLVCFVIPMLLVAVVQETLISNATRNLSDKADFADTSLAETLNGTVLAMTELVSNPAFQTAFNRQNSSDLVNQLRLLSLGKVEVEMAEVINSKGMLMTAYPVSTLPTVMDNTKENFYSTVMKSGGNYISRNLESLRPGIDNVLLVAVPITTTDKTVSGILVVALSGINLTNYLQQVGEKTLGQEVIVVGENGKTLVYPNVTKLGMILNEGDASLDIWRNGLTTAEGYNWNGEHSVFGASGNPEYGFTVVISQPIWKVLDISTSWLAWLLFIQLIGGMVVFMAFIYVKNAKPKEAL